MPAPRPAVASTKTPFLLGVAAATVGLAATGFLVGSRFIRTRRHFALAGTTAVVTGGSRGIGLAVAHELARRGANVAICARNEQELAAAQRELAGHGTDIVALPCDVTDADAIAVFLGRVRDRFGKIDVLVNNAGLIAVGPLAHMTLEDFQQAMRVNYEAPLRFILDVMPEMRRRRSGRIVNVASFGGKIPSPHLAAYAASKHALVGLSESLRTELTADGVYVTTVCPGLTRSGSAGTSATFKGNHEAEKAWFVTGDVTPGVSISVHRLARKIVDAMQAGDAELTAPLAASVQAKLHGLMPGLTTEIATLVNRLLPGPTDSAGDQAKAGRDVSDAKVPAVARVLEDRAERDGRPR